MAGIAQVGLCSWKEIEAHSDLDRLRMVVLVIPDEDLMRKLEAFWGKGRDDYPMRAVWNSLLAARGGVSASFGGLLVVGVVAQWGASSAMWV
jgi:hypothetical protein